MSTSPWREVLMRFLTIVGAGVLAALAASPAHADAFKLYAGGDNVVSNTGPASDPTVFRLTSDPSGAGYGGMELQVTNTLLLSNLTTLSADYQMVTGSFGGGSPRFTLFDQSLGSAYI